ncbi:hypothetical protein ACI65C_006881 [Semiaphis heraclei]
MSTRNNNNNNNNNKDISKMNNAVSPLTISKNKTSNSSLGTSNNPLDVGWTIQKSKRNLSSSTNSEPNSPETLEDKLAEEDRYRLDFFTDESFINRNSSNLQCSPKTCMPLFEDSKRQNT